MLIGVPCEVKDGERRVALLPAQVRPLTGAGVRVRVQSGAGVAAAATDEDYLAAGASVCSQEEVWASDLVVKVKEPLPEEFRFFRPGLRLFAFLHLAAEPALTQALLASGVRAFAFEDLLQAGRRPLLRPMSQVAGRSAAVTAASLLSTVHGGSGLLPGGVDGAPAASALVLGTGAAGEAAVRSLSALGMRVTGVDVDELVLARLLAQGLLVAGLRPDDGEFSDMVASSDVLVSSVLVPSQRAPHLVSSEMVSRMRPGSVVVDVAIDQGGSLGTSRPTSLSDPVYVEHGVLHYCVPNIPGQFPRTASAALSSALLPFVLELSAAAAAGRDTVLHGALAVADGLLLPRR